ncbi:hypothetical protein H6P81_016115 [Aristolochia fimbriata]|uniref:Uncharacterized protein n=1 Tax=Aristolochia fimbriata TaxID=158543 RepID=A0AAV7E9H0_ARIFI|nr:hypothetical protein H6P81_016115 [Aristolochia fimbriata]
MDRRSSTRLKNGIDLTVDKLICGRTRKEIGTGNWHLPTQSASSFPVSFQSSSFSDTTQSSKDIVPLIPFYLDQYEKVEKERKINLEGQRKSNRSSTGREREKRKGDEKIYRDGNGDGDGISFLFYIAMSLYSSKKRLVGSTKAALGTWKLAHDPTKLFPFQESYPSGAFLRTSCGWEGLSLATTMAPMPCSRSGLAHAKHSRPRIRAYCPESLLVGTRTDESALSPTLI